LFALGSARTQSSLPTIHLWLSVVGAGRVGAGHAIPGISLAIIALINNTSAIKVRDDDDLYTDDGQVADTLASIKNAEKQHGTTFNSLTQ